MEPSTYLLIVVVSMLVGWAANVAASSLNVFNMSSTPPEEFARSVSDADYARNVNYTRAGAKLTVVAESVELALTLGFILLGGFPVVDAAARALGFGPIGTGLVFFGILMALSNLAGLPFSYYRTFVIEERFGFNRTTLRTFILDRIKGVFLGVVIGGPVAGMVLWFFEAAGSMAWLYAWVGVTVVLLGIQYVAPTLILPLFNKFRPMEDGPLREMIEDYARRQNFQLSGLYIIDGSKRSAKANAYFTGLGSKKRIALFDTLLRQLSDKELLGVLAHETGHWRLGHIPRNICIGIVQTGVILFLMSLLIDNPDLHAAFGMQAPTTYAGLVFFMMLYAPVSMLTGIAAKAHSRRCEYQADRFAAETLGGAGDLIRSLKRLYTSNLANLEPHPFMVFLNYSHPPVLERIRALREVESAMSKKNV